MTAATQPTDTTMAAITQAVQTGRDAYSATIRPAVEEVESAILTRSTERRDSAPDGRQ
jgi:hypothetical protein